MIEKAILLHNPKCQKSRQALTLLEAHDIDFEIRNYLTEPLDKPTLKKLLKALGMTAAQLMRKKESEYKQLCISDMTPAEQEAALLSHPKLMERPIFWLKDKAVIGRPPENILSIL